MSSIAWQLSVLMEGIEGHLRRLHRHRERYVKAWLAATGIRPEEAELVETVRGTPTGVETVVVIRRRRDER